jgi:hypothetical protein
MLKKESSVQAQMPPRLRLFTPLTMQHVKPQHAVDKPLKEIIGSGESQQSYSA